MEGGGGGGGGDGGGGGGSVLCVHVRACVRACVYVCARACVVSMYKERGEEGKVVNGGAGGGGERKCLETGNGREGGEEAVPQIEDTAAAANISGVHPS